MKVILYLHSDKESSRDAAERAGISGKALDNAMYLGYEHKMEYEVDPSTGNSELIAVDGRKLS